MTDAEKIEKLQWQVDALTKVVAQLTDTRLFNNSGVHFPKDRPLKFDDLGPRGPAQAKAMMDEYGLLG